MKSIFVNLKRFDIPENLGGICPESRPDEWIRNTVAHSVELGIGLRGKRIVYFLPESLISTAAIELGTVGKEALGDLAIGCQGVFRSDAKKGGNFGAFTSNRPAAAMKALDCAWVMVGHSEERADKTEMLSMVSEDTNTIGSAVDSMLRDETRCAVARGMNVLFCVGETSAQKGSDDPVIYEPRVRETLKKQLCGGLSGIEFGNTQIVIGYEPVWAIGPGKTPPNGDYVSFVSSYIKEVCREALGFEPEVVYGGGLKEANAAEIASVATIDGGLIALTKFTQPIAFDVDELGKIIEAYERGLKTCAIGG